MRYHQPFDQPNAPLAAFVNGNSTTGQQGSIPPAEQMEYPQREAVNAIAAAGLTPSDGDLTQIAQAMSIGLWLGAMGGSANAISDTLPVLTTTSDGVTAYAIPALVPGMTFHGIIPAANTGPATLTLTGFGTAPGAKPIVTKSGAPLQAGDLPAGAIVTWKWDGAAYRVTSVVQSDITALIGATTRVNAPGPITIYVRTDGSDSNLAGQTNSAASAFATLQAAYNYLTRSYNPGFTAAIQLGIQGTYAGIVAQNNGVTGQISIFGDQTAGQGNQVSYIITPVPFSTGYSCVLSAVQTIFVDGVTLDASNLNAGQSVQIARAGGQGALTLGRVTLRYSGNNPNVTVASADPAASLNFAQNFTVAVGTVGSIIGALGQVGVLNSAGVTMAIANATFNSFANVQGGTTNLQSMTFSGAGNAGSRYNVSNEATLLPPTAGSYAAIPGSTAGSVTLGGGYVPGDPGPAWTQFSTSINSTGGQFGSAAVFFRYQRWGKTVFFMAQISIGTVGGASGAIVTQLPVAPQGGYSFCGVEAAVNGKSVSVRPQAGGGQVQINNYDGTSAIVAGGLYYITGVYEAAN